MRLKISKEDMDTLEKAKVVCSKIYRRLDIDSKMERATWAADSALEDILNLVEEQNAG